MYNNTSKSLHFKEDTMEYGLIPKIDQYRDNKEVEIQTINASTQTAEAKEQNKLQELQKEEFIKAGKADQVQKTDSESLAPKYEVTLTNMNFGFNDSSKDFFVRATRGTAENQYPTEQMMRLKSYLMSLDNSSVAS